MIEQQEKKQKSRTFMYLAHILSFVNMLIIILFGLHINVALWVALVVLSIALYLVVFVLTTR